MRESRPFCPFHPLIDERALLLSIDRLMVATNVTRRMLCLTSSTYARIPAVAPRADQCEGVSTRFAGTFVAMRSPEKRQESMANNPKCNSNQSRAHIAERQRKRRSRVVRIDYVPSAASLAAIKAMRAKAIYALARTNRAVIDAILSEWAKLTGTDCGRPSSLAGSARVPEFHDHSARAYDFGKRRQRRACGAKRHRDGQPCCAPPESGKRRCRFHGGRSTGPRTEQGKARALANLCRGRKNT